MMDELVATGTTSGARSNLHPEAVLQKLPTAVTWAPPILVGLAVIACYAYSLSIKPLLDEQYLLQWAQHGDVSGSALAAFNAQWASATAVPSSAGWGPLIPSLLAFASKVFPAGKYIFAHRFGGICLHLITSVAFFFVVRGFAGSRLLAGLAAALFAVYPLNAEAVTWIGARGSLLGTTFVTLAICAYQRARGLDLAGYASNRVSWPWLASALVLLFVSLACAPYMAFALSALVAYEVLWFSRSVVNAQMRSDNHVSRLSAAAVCLLSMLFLAAVYYAATSAWMAFLDPSSRWQWSGQAAWLSIKNMFMPVNQATWHGYAKQYRFLYFFLPPLLAVFIPALVRTPWLLRISAFAGIWWLGLVAGLTGKAAATPDLYKSHLLYAAAEPVCLIFACMCLSIWYLCRRWPWPRLALGMIAGTIMFVFFFRHAFNQLGSYNAYGRQLGAVQASIAVNRSKEGDRLLAITDLPETVALAPGFATVGLIGFSSGSGLMNTPCVPAGRLKDQLKAGHFGNAALRWDPDLGGLLPFDLMPYQALMPHDLDATGIANRLIPGIAFYRNASLDQQNAVLILDSNAATGPSLRLGAADMSPIDGDFLYVDACITAPPAKAPPTIELYWQTTWRQDFDNTDRRIAVPAIVNDGQFHRYYLSLRTYGWLANGSPSLITLGFPAGAKVQLKGMGLAGKEKLLPELSARLSVAGQSAKGPSRYNMPSLDFPTVPELGLYAVPQRDSLQFSYSCRAVDGADAVLVEVSQPGKHFENANGTVQSPQAGSVFTIGGGEGHFALSAKDAPTPGIYEVRTFALDRARRVVGCASDPVVVSIAP